MDVCIVHFYRRLPLRDRGLSVKKARASVRAAGTHRPLYAPDLAWRAVAWSAFACIDKLREGRANSQERPNGVTGNGSQADEEPSAVHLTVRAIP